MRVPLGLLVLVVALSAGAGGASDLTREAASDAATAFGRALTAGRAGDLRPVLPRRGKVGLTLARLGPEDGAFGSSQVEALFREFLARGAVASFKILQCESDGKTAALAHARAAVTDREGQRTWVGIHLGFQPEDGRWVLREVKETAE